MSEISFRKHQPKRTYAGAVMSNYRAYKPFLQKDFSERCGYTDCPQFWFGGASNFHIDHFKPKSIYGDLVNEYTNLVYACSFVNRAKSDDDGTYLDPCNVDYNEHFIRDAKGNILPREDSAVANYMYAKLKLYLKRYGIIWMLDQLEQMMFVLGDLITQTGNAEAKELYVEVGLQYDKYKKYLRAVQ